MKTQSFSGSEAGKNSLLSPAVRAFALVFAVLLAPASVALGQLFPAIKGWDTLPTSSPFHVTIGLDSYSAFVTDPATKAGYSGVFAEQEEATSPAREVDTAGYLACSNTVSDADIGCFPSGLPNEPGRREIHTEMLSLNLSGKNGEVTVTYLAGQPAADALAGRPGAVWYRNSCGEMVSLSPNPNASDFPARSFWAIHGVVTITPAPPNTCGVFYTKDPFLMDLNPVNSIPPSGSLYNFVPGNSEEDWTGTACGALPVALYDADSNLAVGRIDCPAKHIAEAGPRFIKWEQPPDVTTNGLDVLATGTNLLADDFLCQLSGPISGIHLWGSWLNDQSDPVAQFWLGIWSDVPATTNAPSHPGVLLWSECFSACDYVAEPAAQANEQFYDPNLSQILGADTSVWLYSFYPTNPWYQVEGTVYWVSARAMTSSNLVFGWKTSANRYRDDAVLGHLGADGQSLGDWVDLHYPPGSTNPSVSLAFKLGTTITTNLYPWTVVVPAGFSALIANPYHHLVGATINNDLNLVLGNVPDFTMLAKYDSSAQLLGPWLVFDSFGGGWCDLMTGEPVAESLDPGEGACLTAPAGPVILTFQGAWPGAQAPLTLEPGRFYLRSARMRTVGDVGTYEDLVGAAPVVGSAVLKFISVLADYEFYVYESNGWTTPPGAPHVSLAESAFVVLRPALLAQSATPGHGTLVWNAPANWTLQWADSVAGRWADIPGATSPYPVSFVDQKFYRLRAPPPGF